MIDRDHEQLIEDVLDGQATPGDRARLEPWLAMTEEGPTRMRHLEGLFATLDRVPFAELPVGLASEVEQAIRARAPSRASAVRRPFWAAAPRTRLAMVFAAGLAAGVIGWGAVTGILRPGAPGRESVVGTMMPATRAPKGSLSRNWSAGETKVEASTWRAGTSRWVRLAVEGRAPAEVELRFDAAALSSVAVRQSDPSARVALDPGRILIRVASRGQFTFEFGEPGPAGSIQVIARAADGSFSEALPSP